MCQWDTTIYVPETDTPKIEYAISNVLCYGDSSGQIIITSIDSQTIHCSWNIGNTTCSLVNVPAGTYNVTITNSVGCKEVFHFTIYQPPPLSLSVFASPDTNNQHVGSAWAHASGGSPPYSYVWSTGDTVDSIWGLETGIYTISVRDSNGCAAIDSAYIGNVTLSSAGSYSPVPLMCNYQSGGNIIKCSFSFSAYEIYSLDSKMLCNEYNINSTIAHLKCPVNSKHFLIVLYNNNDSKPLVLHIGSSINTNVVKHVPVSLEINKNF